MKYRFKKSLGSDNHSGVHPAILAAIAEVNVSHAPSYGMDPVSLEAEQEFQRVFGSHVKTFFVFNGTAANVLCVKALLKSYEAVIAAETSHLNSDECGAPEFIAGVKVIPVRTPNGKITPEDIKARAVRRGDQHASQVRMVSITQPTELGTVYTLKELKEIRKVTRDLNLFLHVDGTRLIHAATTLQCELSDLTSEIDIDCLSFGGTKNGLLGAEAVVFFKPECADDFKFFRKQGLQLPSKTRFMAAQFLAFLTNDLWREISAHSCAMAQRLAQQLSDIPEVTICQKVESNAVFVRVPQSWIKPLREHTFFYVWDESDWTLRWMTSYDTQAEEIDQFILKIKGLR